MEDKLAKKKSIRDYVAKIDSKQLKMAAKYHGDSDLPYRDNNKYSKTGVRQPLDNSADLDGADWDAEDNKTASAVRNGTNDDDEDNYYEEVAGSKAAKKEAKLAEYEAGRVPIVDGDFKVEDGHKRLASYQILKNKGLTPHRRKTVRNTRVKHRNKFEKQVKKLSSVKQIVKEQHSGYGGESTGIKTNVARSVKLSQ
ncbi:hypothetical protein PHYBLDRAFT_159902 [Phycomyces blakesleeanus NRRL 1555(-)]|uniref:Sas10 C-terminal domain-containing protein n=2 Tax=Phycomyces blakesleeanus TaxID=4837 RepID=A0A162WNK8_PHYB8|nr:hypothetical protein PHYBLDRAFT_159902 [Phycomyces blakesleeanus NRRL 1555(-)]OAD69295.1 hypothetical protein PHYBLDRAFT_159902 [Phycomyces blakesleeanus NRRL 1555(-)]|eukprot:XP_018287335.1 hypothetical protein PHYBLDRAFT_159902 [Phycomyces blakesleeanus NRRL 1555(-)]